MTEPVLREARPDEDAAIRACIAEAFPDNPKARADVLRWQYRDNPFGTPSSWVWVDGDRVVAHYTNYPVPCLLDGRVAVAGVAVDAAVTPEYQGRRLFGPLSRALYADSATKGMAVSLAYLSNPIAVKGIVSAGWREVARLRTLVLPTDDAWLARRFHVPRVLASAGRKLVFRLGRGATGREVTVPPTGLDELWQRWRDAGDLRNGIIRDGAWWRWRYVDSPLGPYRFFEVRRGAALVGAAVVTERDAFGGRFAYLLEFLADDRRAARALLRAVAGSVTDVAGIAAIAVAGEHLDRVARSGGMRRLPRRLEPKGMWFGFVDNGGGTAHLRQAPWAIQWGDLDHI